MAGSSFPTWRAAHRGIARHRTSARLAALLVEAGVTEPHSMKSHQGAQHSEADDERTGALGSDFAEFSQGMASDIRTYVQQQVRLVKLDASYKAAQMLAGALFKGALVLFGAGVALFLSLALAWYLSALLESDVLGFGAVALVYAILLIGFMLWWRAGARDRFMVARLNDLLHGE